MGVCSSVNKSGAPTSQKDVVINSGYHQFSSDTQDSGAIKFVRRKDHHKTVNNARTGDAQHGGFKSNGNMPH